MKFSHSLFASLDYAKALTMWRAVAWGFMRGAEKDGR
jgi:hypothetical protein